MGGSLEQADARALSHRPRRPCAPVRPRPGPRRAGWATARCSMDCAPTAKNFRWKLRSRSSTPAEGKLFTVILRDITERVRAQEELSSFAAEAHNHARRREEPHRARAARRTGAVAHRAEDGHDLAARQRAGRAGKGRGQAGRHGHHARYDGGRHAPHCGRSAAAAAGRPRAWRRRSNGWPTTSRNAPECRARLSVDEDLELEEPYATAVFRIVQESLANVGKHAARQSKRAWSSRAPARR